MNKNTKSLEFEHTAFSAALVRYLTSFNLIDKNVGLCISFLVNSNDPRASYPLLERLNTQAKLDVLRELLFYKRMEKQSDMLDDFTSWFKRMSESKVQRNRFIHGQWYLIPNQNGKPVAFSPTTWTAGIGREKTRLDKEQRLSISEFEAVATELEQLLNEFSSLRKKHSL